MNPKIKRVLLITLALVAALAVVTCCGGYFVLGSKVNAAQEADFRADASKRGFTNQRNLTRESEKEGEVLELVIQFKGTKCEAQIELERVLSPWVLFPSQAKTPNVVEQYRFDEVLINSQWQEAETRVNTFKTELPPDNPTPTQVDDFLAKHNRFKPLCPRK